MFSTIHRTVIFIDDFIYRIIKQGITPIVIRVKQLTPRRRRGIIGEVG